MKTCVFPGLLSILMMLSSPCTTAAPAANKLPDTKPATIEVVLAPTSEQSATLNFTASDGVNVTGQLLLPNSPASKLALLLHPMGSDQTFWTRADHAMHAHRLSHALRKDGYLVVTLDARLHGSRAEPQITARDLLASARSDNPTLYHNTIQGTIQDYTEVLAWAETEYQPQETLVMGYSMGAQMSLILAAQNTSIDHVIVMVPPYVDVKNSPVAPRAFTEQIDQASVLWIAAKQDEYSDPAQTQATFDLIPSQSKRLTWLNSGHRLPLSYTDIVLEHLTQLTLKSGQERAQ